MIKNLNPMVKIIFLLFIGMAFLFIILLATQKAVYWKKRAVGHPANIVIDIKQTGQPINPTLWQNFAQGGEENNNMIEPAVPFLRSLEPKLIRIDHIYDYYVAIKGKNNFDFSRLDKIVETILKINAKPMLSLSYIPSALSIDGKITSPPKDWNEWQNLIKATILHYSGKENLNIPDIYYEVFNEPDLFGQWHYSKSPNYLELYFYSAKAAQEAESFSQPFKMGGPATTGLYPAWIQALLTFAEEKNLKLDFISWHQYSLYPEDYIKDFEALNKILTNNSKWFTLERIISEFGPETKKSSWYQNPIGASHDLAVITQIADRVHRVFAFEIKDGPNDTQGWGLLTHQSKGLSFKPRWHAYQFLQKLRGTRVFLTGEGTWVYGLAAKENEKINILLVNFDPENSHFESPPITVRGLTPGRYQINRDYLFGQDSSSLQETVETTLSFNILLPPNEAVIVNLSPL